MLEVNSLTSTEGFDGQGDLIRSLKREIKNLKGKVIAQDIRIFEMQALLQSGKGLSNILNLPQLLDTFMAVVRERYDLVNSCVILKEDFENGEKEFYQVKSYYGVDDHYVDQLGRREPLFLFRIEKNNGLLWQIIRQGNVFSVRDLQKEPRFVTAWERLNLDVLRSDLWCPLIKSGEVVGILALGEKRDGTQVPESEFAFVQEMASLATTIIDSTLKYEKNQRILSNIQILYDFHQEMSSITDFKVLCKQTIKKAVTAVCAQKGNLMILNRATGKLELVVAWGYIDETVLDGINSGRIETKAFEMGEGVAGKAGLQRKPVVVNNRDEIPQMGAFETYCICSVPVLNGGQLEGVMNFTNKVHLEEDGSAILDTLGRFTREDVTLLQGIADQSAVSLHKSRLYSASITDRLTGLNNSRYFEDTYYELVAKSTIENKPVTLALLDIDHFKQFNDQHGHKAGDAILKAVAQAFSEIKRPGHKDYAYRYGGEEFVLVMQDTTAEEAKKVLDQFRTELAGREFDYQGSPLKVTVSIGLAQSGLHTSDARTLFNLADDALYECKRNGRNQVRITTILDADTKVRKGGYSMLQSFILAFTALFVALDIIGAIPIYLSLTKELSGEARVRIVNTSMAVAFLVAVIFVFIGKSLFQHLGITIPDFKIAGGIILILIALSDLLGGPDNKDRGSGSTGIVPLAVPLITGPGILTTLVLQVADQGYLITLAALILNYLIAWWALRYCDLIKRVIGKDGTVVLSKIAALLLAAIAVAMIRAGIVETIAANTLKS